MTKKRRVVSLVLICLLIGMASIIFSGCSRNPIKQESKGYQYAMVRLPDGSCVGGPIESYSYTSNAFITVTIDGIMYRTHPINVILTKNTRE